MLILSRFTEEAIIITAANGDEIRIRLLGVQPRKARIGIDAPRSYAVHREEVHKAIQRESGKVMPG